MNNQFEKLPDAELQVMKAIWGNITPISTKEVKDHLDKQDEKTWNIAALLTLLNRLIGRGFLQTEKQGKNRFFEPLVSENDYLAFETDNFMKSLHGNSVYSLINTLAQSQKISPEDMKRLQEWFNTEEE